MYRPKHFAGSETAAIEIMQRFPFATMITQLDDGELFINHLPLMTVVDNAAGKISLVGHMAKRNPQWMHFLTRSKVKVVFNGPHGYVTPRWYVSGRDVPTWNYAVCHVNGRVRLIQDPEGLKDLLRGQTTYFEQAMPSPWDFELPDDLRSPEALTSAIVGFVIDVETCESKVKMSQNRTEADRRSVREGLRSTKSEANQSLAEMMERFDPGL